ncbi:hypothetical protein ETI05_03535 [Macrococcoides canis]|uniref:hypothetical protein n=1 Tax=Macrococcoides canis TaxID=1855823 RepID=UPI00105D7C4B|nr:hypothetical protein [Macrococcus canis]TDM21827.1 hypothetical protein ETI05_03535 [Macrococcus canis]
MERYITVNKEVFISDEYIKAKRDDHVLNVSDLNENAGFTQFVLVFQGGQFCCEDSDINIIGENPFNKSLFVSGVKIESLDNYETENGWGLNEGGAMKVTLITPDFNYAIIFYNAHNGYYCHSIDMEHLENGEISFKYNDFL